MIKKLLLSLFWIITIWLVNFWYCSTYYDIFDSFIISSWSIDLTNTYQNLYVFSDTNEKDVCIALSRENKKNIVWWFANESLSSTVTVSVPYWQYFNDWDLTCSHWNKVSIKIKYNVSATWVVDYKLYNLTSFLSSTVNFPSCPDCPTCPSCSSCESDLLSCQSDLATATWNLATCQNDLINCGWSMTWDCQQNTWEIQRSSLYINDIQHLWSENINITIPEEISWNYTWDNQDFDLVIEGYNTDSDYIAWIITTQNSKPTKSDLNYIISSLIPLFVPWLVIILFIYFVFKFIKKAF